MMNEKPKFLLILGSRKFWAAVIGILFVVIKAYLPDFPVSEDQLTGLVVVLVGYILGVALEDGLTARALSARSGYDPTKWQQPK